MQVLQQQKIYFIKFINHLADIYKKKLKSVFVFVFKNCSQLSLLSLIVNTILLNYF